MANDPVERKKQFYRLLDAVEEGEELDSRILQIIKMRLQEEETTEAQIERIVNGIREADYP